MKLPQIFNFIRKSRKINNEETEEDKQYFDQLVQNLKENPKNKINIQNLNTFLLQIQNTKKTSVVKKTYIKFYDSLVELFEFDSAKIIAFLKANINPAVTTDVVEHRFRGLKTKITDFMEEKVLRRKMITHCNNKVTERPLLRLYCSSECVLKMTLTSLVNVAPAMTYVAVVVVCGSSYCSKQQWRTVSPWCTHRGII